MDIFDELAARWPSALVARKEVKQFTGGLLNPRTMANYDSQGRGPRGKIKLGTRAVAYPVANLVLWLRGRSTVDGK